MASREKMSSLCVENVNNEFISESSTKISVTIPAVQSLEVALKDNRKKYADKVQALLYAWEQVIAYMNREFSLSVFEFMHGQTLYLILRGDWPHLTKVVKNHLLVLLQRCLKYLKSKNVNSNSISRCSSLVSLVANPWGHATLMKLINGHPTTEAEVMEYFKAEKGELITIRLELLIVSKCEDVALKLAAAAVRWIRVPNSGCESNSTVDQRNFFLDVYLTTLCRFKRSQELILELKSLDLKEGLELVRRYCSASWPSNYNSTLSSSTSLARIWKYGNRVAEIAAHTFLASAMVQPPSPLLADLVLEWALIHGPTLRSAPETLFNMIKKILTTAESVENVFIFSEVLVKQYGDCVKPICIEFGVRFLSAEMNDLLQFKHKSEQDKQREIEIKLSSGFLKLADLVGSSHVDIYRECVLTGFSLEPTTGTLDKIKALAVGNQTDAVSDTVESNLAPEEKTDENVPPSKSTVKLQSSIMDDAPPNEVNPTDKDVDPDKHGTLNELPSEVSQMKKDVDPEKHGTPTEPVTHTSDTSSHIDQIGESGETRYFEQVSNEDSNGLNSCAIYSSNSRLSPQVTNVSNFEKEGKSLGLSTHLMDDLLTVIRGSRYQVLNWDYEWSELKSLCENYLNNFSTVRETNKELKYLKIDYNQFKDWPEDDDKDNFNGIEKGYEKWIEGSDESDEPMSGSASQSINDSDFESSDSFTLKKPLKRKEASKRRSDSDSEYEIGKYKSKKKRKKSKKASKVTDSDNGTLDSIKSTSSVLREKLLKKKKKTKKAKDFCKGTLRRKTSVKNAKNISSQVDDALSNESKFSDKLSSDNENDNNNSTFLKACIGLTESCKNMKSINSSVIMNDGNKPYSKTQNLKILRTFRKSKPELKSKMGFRFFSTVEDDFPLTNDSPTRAYSPNSSLSTVNPNNHSLSNKVELSNGYEDDYLSDNCKYTFKEDEPLNICEKLKPFTKFDKNNKIKFDSFDMSREDKSAIQNTVSELSSISNIIPSETTATVQVVQVTNHASGTVPNSALLTHQTSSTDKPAPQSTSASTQSSPAQPITYSSTVVSQSGAIKIQTASNAESQSSSQVFSTSIPNNISALIESSETQNTSETITLQRAEPLSTPPILKVPMQAQNTLIIQNQSADQKQASSSSYGTNIVKPPRSSAFVFVASGDSSNSVARTSGISQQQVQQTLINLANSSFVGTNIDNNTATLFKADDGRKNENVVQLTVSRDSRVLLAQQVANIKRSESTVNVVISQSANFPNARIVEAKGQNAEAQKASSTNSGASRFESSSSIIRTRPAVTQVTQNASLPKFQQAFGKAMYQSVTCPVVSGNISEGKVVNLLELNQVQIQRDNPTFSSGPAVSKGVQTNKDSNTCTQKPESSESMQIVVKEENVNNQTVPVLQPQTIAQIKTAQVKTSAIQTSPGGVIFTCKRLAVVKEPEGSGDASASSTNQKKPDTKIVKEQMGLNDLLRAAIQAPVQTTTVGPNVINILNPLNQIIQISNSSDDSNKNKTTLTGSTQRLTIPSIIHKTGGRQTVLQPSTYKLKQFQTSDSSQTAVLKLPLSARSAFLSTIANINQPVSGATPTVSTVSSPNQNRIGSRESLVIRNRLEPNVSTTTMESSTTEQLREFESVLEKVTKTSQMKERINVQLHTPLDTSVTSSESNSTGFSSVASSQSNSSVLTPSSTTMELQGDRVLSFVTQASSSGLGTQKLSSSTPVVVVQSCRRQAASPTLSITSQNSSSPVPCSSGKAQKSSKSSKAKIVKTPPVTSPLKVTPTIPKPQQKPQEDEQTTQRIYAILDKYAEQLRNSPELKNKPAPRRRSNPPTNPTQSSKRKKSSQSRSRSNSQLASCSLGLDMSPSSEDVRTMGSEDSSNGVSQLSQMTGSPSRIDETPATPSSETSESLDARDSRIQIQVQPQPQSQSVVTSRALIVQDSALTSADAAKIFSAQSRQQTVVSNAGTVPLPPGTVRLLLTKGPKMYKIQQMVPMVLRPGSAKITGGITAQNIGTVAGQQAVVLPTGTRSFTFTEATGEQTVNLDSTVIPASISLLQLQGTNSANNISTITSVASTNLPKLNSAVSENSNLPATSSFSNVSQFTLSQTGSSSANQILLDSNSKGRSVWTDFSSVESSKPVLIELVKPIKNEKIEASGFSHQNELKIAHSSSPSMMKPDDSRMENSLDTIESKDDPKPILLMENEIKKEPKEVEDSHGSTCDESVHWQQFLSKEDTSQDDKSLQTMNQTVSDVNLCNTTSASLTLSHAKRKGSTLDSTLFQSTYRRSDRLQTGKRSDGSQQKKAELKSLSEECKDLGVAKPSTSDLFPEAELLLDLDPSSQEAEIQLLLNPESNYNNKESGLNFSQGDGVTNLKTYARANMKSKLKLCSSPNSHFLKMCSDSDSPILGQPELCSSPDEKTHLKTGAASSSSNLDVGSSRQDSTFGSQPKIFSQCDSPKPSLSLSDAASSSKAKKRAPSRSHCSSSCRSEKRSNLSLNPEPQLPPESSVNGGLDLDSDSTDFKKSLRSLIDDEEKLPDNSMDHDYPSPTTPTHSSSDTVFSSDPQLSMFDSTNNPFICSSSQNNFRSRNRLKSSQDNQDADSFWSLLKKSDQGEDLDSDKTATSDTEDPASDGELTLSSNGLGKKRSGSFLKSNKSKIIKEDLDVASSASSPEITEGEKLRVPRRSSTRGLVKKPCSCCNGSPEQPKRKNHSHISSSSCSSVSRKSHSSKTQSLLKSALKRR